MVLGKVKEVRKEVKELLTVRECGLGEGKRGEEGEGAADGEGM